MFTILFPFIDIASAPANFNSFIKVLKSLATIDFSLLSSKVTIIPSPVTAVFPTNKFVCSNSLSNNSDACSFESIFALYSSILFCVSANFSSTSSYFEANF